MTRKQGLQTNPLPIVSQRVGSPFGFDKNKTNFAFCKHYNIQVMAYKFTSYKESKTNHIIFEFLKKMFAHFCCKNSTIFDDNPTGAFANLKCELVNDLADKYNRTKQNILIRWGFHMGFAVICNSSSLKTMESNLKHSFDFELTEHEIHDLCRLSERTIKKCLLKNFTPSQFSSCQHSKNALFFNDFIRRSRRQR